MQFSLVALPWWAYLLVTLCMTHATIAAVTIYLHRHQAHRALELHPVISHTLRLWLWLSTGMITREWVAIHRKHHACTETPGDPHSPRIHGIRKVLLQGAELYRQESRNQQTISKYGHNTPDDWIERRLYARHSVLGVSLMMVIDLLLFGPIGLTIWAVQMIWIPFFAAGVINGIGHYWGYRCFAPDDASTNIVPWGILVGGEELHNNHHAYISSARFSQRWWEFDIGWLYIRILEICRLATVRRVAPRVHLGKPKARCDQETLRAILVHRHEVLQRFEKAMRLALGDPAAALSAAEAIGSSRTRARETTRRGVQVSTTFDRMRRKLIALWARSSDSTEQLVSQLNTWCHNADQSGISHLRAFSRRLRRYEMLPGEFK